MYDICTSCESKSQDEVKENDDTTGDDTETTCWVSNGIVNKYIYHIVPWLKN